MKRWIKSLVYLGVGFVALAALGILVERIRGEMSLHRRLSSLEAKGEVLALSKLKPKRAASNENVFVELLAITNRLEQAHNLEILPPSMRLAGPGQAVVAATLHDWLYGKPSANWQQVDELMAKLQPTLAAIETAVHKPVFDGGIDYDKGFVDLHAGQIAIARQASQFLHGSILHALHTGDLLTAHRRLSTLLELTAKQTPEALIVNQLVRRASVNWAFNDTWQALQTNGWTDAQLASLQADWRACHFAEDMTRAMEMERAMTLDFYEQIRSSGQKLQFVIQTRESYETNEIAFVTLPTHGFPLHWIHLPIWRLAWAPQDQLASLEQWQFIVERQRLAQRNGWSALGTHANTPIPFFPNSQSIEGSPGFYDRMRYLFANETFAANERIIWLTLQAQTLQQMAIAALGIERYRLKNGNLPASLEALVPEFLAEIPNDFMDGKKLRYHRATTGHDFILYSVGDDGKDDKGDASFSKEKKIHNILDGRDIVWPSAASVESAQQAVTQDR